MYKATRQPQNENLSLPKDTWERNIKDIMNIYKYDFLLFKDISRWYINHKFG